MASASVYSNGSPIGYCLASVETANSEGRVGVCVCVCASARECARVRASVRECGVRTSVLACVRDVFAIYDDNILSRLILIIIKIIILYFIQIRHTDDFPSAGIPASTTNVWCNLDSRTG